MTEITNFCRVTLNINSRSYSQSKIPIRTEQVTRGEG